MNNMIYLSKQGLHADVYTANYEFEFDNTINRTDTGTETERTLTHKFELQYSQRVVPRLDVSYFLRFEIENDFPSEGDNKTRLLPEMEINGTADYWTFDLGAKRTRETTDVPFDPASITDNYFVEYILEPSDRVPDLKLKYTIDTDEKGDETNTVDTSFEASSVYQLGDIVKLKVDYTRDEGNDKVTPDSDTIDEEFKTEETMQYIFSKKIKFDFRHSFERSTGATLLDAGGKTSEENTQKNTLDAKLKYLIFPKTDLGVDYKFEREDDKIESSVDKSHDFGFTFDQDILEIIDFSFSYEKTIDDEVGPSVDKTDTEDTFTYELNVIFSILLDFSLTYEETLTDSEDKIDIQNSLKTETDNFDFTWQMNPEAFWSLRTSYTWNVDREEGLLTSKTRDISVKSDFDFEAINLGISADYSLFITEDFTQPTGQETRTTDFNFNIDYDTEVTHKLSFSFSHQFGRSVDQPGKIINRNDDTKIDFTLDEPWRGSSFNLSLSRNATDTSGDDSEADITSNVSFSWDHSYEIFTFSINYKFDKKNLADDSETFDLQVGWVGLNFTTDLTYSFDKTFSAELDESHSLTFNFTIEI